MSDLDHILEHYGILGMKWGVRRSDEELARARGRRLESGKPVTPAKKYSDDAARAKRVSERVGEEGIQALSNKELEEFTRRMQIERSYRKEIASQPSTVDQGQAFAKKFLDIGNTANQAIAFVNSPAGKMVRKAIVGV